MPSRLMALPLGLLIAASMPALAAAELRVVTDFEGASARVLSLDAAEQHLVFTPAGDPQRGWPCWWSMRLEGLQPGKTLTLELDGKPMRRASGHPLSPLWAMPTRAAYSADGETWLQTAPGRRDGVRMTWTLTPQAPSLRVAWGPPFVPGDARALVKRLAAAGPHTEAFELCTTHGGRSVPALKITQDSAEDPSRFGVWIQARQHAWEAGSSWVGRGFAEWVVSDDPRAVALRRRAVIYYVPIMDVDSVAEGQGGKERDPRDHNRDWDEKPKWKAVAAAQQWIKTLDRRGRFDVFVDLHNPGPNDVRPFYYTVPRDQLSELGRRNLDRFIAAGVDEITGPLKLADKHRESGANYDKAWRRISKNWVHGHTAGHVVAVTLETAWNTPDSHVEGYMAVGRQLGLSIERYFRESPRQ